MGCGFAGIATAPTITASMATTNPSVNAGFNGSTNANIFNGTTGLLKQTEKITVRFTARVNLTCGAALPNAATVGATGGGAPISSPSTKPAAAAAATAAGASPAAAAASAAAALPNATPESIAAAVLAAGGSPAAAAAAGKTACTSLVGGATGANQTVCYYEATAPLSVPVGVPTGAWVGGTGTFTPNRTTANATYTPTLAENGTTVILTWVPAPAAAICTLYDLTTDVTVRLVPTNMSCANQAATRSSVATK